MKRTFFFLLLFSLLSFSQESGKNFIVTGKITGLANGAEVRLSNNADKSELAKANVSQGQFVLKGSVPEPGIYTLASDNLPPFQFYLENSKITIKGDVKDMEKLQVTGSISQKDFLDFLNVIDPLMRQQNAAVSTINSMVPGADRDKLINIYFGIQSNLKKQIEKFVTTKPHSYVSPFVLLSTAQYFDDIPLLEKWNNLLNATVKNSQIGSSLNQYIVYKQVGNIGTNAIDFTQPDTTGAPVSLSSFKGKYVLVDFWASWCGPCRNENPNVVENFQQFRDKNFTILSVSLDRPGQKDKWVEAIHHDNLTWTHVSDLQFWNNAVAQLYHIQSIPQNLLIDPSGKIVAKNLRGPELRTKLCEIFGCN
jgi:peroxiredoxin